LAVSEPHSELSLLLRAMAPVLHEGVYVFASLPHGAGLSALDAIATVHEEEGMTVVVAEEAAQRMGLPILFRAAWITLTVHSDLQAVGLTAAFAGALAEAGISCNVMAGACHDHLFVPVEKARKALAALRRLQNTAGVHHE
jgi:uncharacterized protein